MPAPTRRSLRYRLIAAVVLIQALMLALVIGNGVRLAGHRMVALAESRLRLLDDSLDMAVTPLLGAGDRAAVAAAALRLGGAEDVLYLRVLDAGGNPVAETGAVPAPLPEAATALSADVPVHHARLALTVGDQPVGEIRYGLSTRSLRDGTRQMVAQGVALGALAVFFCTFALVTIAVLLNARLRTLAKACGGVASGDYDTRVEAQGDDEVTMLARSFNAMAGAVADKVSHLEANAASLRASNAELQRLAEITAHHLQEPVRSLADCAQALAAMTDGQLDGQAQECMGAVLSATRRADGLLTQLRNYTAIDMAPLPPGATVDLGQCAEQARQALAEKIAAAGADIVIDDLPRAHCDGGQIVTALRLLLENAIDHRGEDAPRIRIHASVDAGRVVVGVTDNGPGVPSEFRDRVFELFETLDRRTNGAGVGLASVRKIVRRHLGNVWITPAAGSGLTVNFTLPKAPAG